MNETMVSVICLTYNHEKYIRNCLDGFVSQKTNFKYEVFVHDDASTDNTASIVHEYADKYPDIIKPIFQKENQYSKRIGIAKNFILPIVSGKYIAYCEGDDYWCDPYKLQKQFDVMEENPDCNLCLHKVEFINAQGEKLPGSHPIKKQKTGKWTTKYFLEDVLSYSFFQLSSYFIRSTVWKNFYNDNLEFRKAADVGDMPLILYTSSTGNVYYINDAMSKYRKLTSGSWTVKTMNNQNIRMKHCESMINMLKEFNKFTDNKYHKYCEYKINHYTFKILCKNRDKEKLKDKKYNDFWKKIDFVNRIKLKTIIFCPFIYRIYKQIKN